MLTVLEKMQDQLHRTLENIKDPEQVEIAAKTENVEKFVDHSKQLKKLILF